MKSIRTKSGRISRNVIPSIALAALFLLGNSGRADDASKLAGTWVATAMVMGGMQAPDQALPSDLHWVFSGDKLTWQSGTTTIKSYTCKLNSTATPRQMDLIDEDEAGGTMKAIYQLEGNVLKLCSDNRPDQARPGGFVSEKGSQVVMWVLQRKG